MQKEKFDIVSFYKFCPILVNEDLRIKFKKNLIDCSLKGTIILSPEGINGTISGLSGFFSSFESFVKTTLKIDKFDITNSSSSNFIPFNKPKVKIKKEVVPIEIKTKVRDGKHLTPREWDEFIIKDDVMLVDVRKPFEYELGTFKGAINPQVNSFREFKEYFSKDFVNGVIFKEGFRHSDYKPGDKLAAVGIGGLVAGSLGVKALAKSGILLKLAKFWWVLLAPLAFMGKFLSGKESSSSSRGRRRRKCWRTLCSSIKARKACIVNDCVGARRLFYFA